MKKRKSIAFSVIVIIALSALGVAFTSKLRKTTQPQETKIEEVQSNVLGESVTVSPTSLPIFSSVNNIVQNTFQETKNAVSQKMAETEKNIINTIQKEVANLTEAQVQSLKVQICKDLGVLSISPNPTP